MPESKRINIPNVKRLTLYGVCRLAKRYSGLIESGGIGNVEGWAIAASLSMASRGSLDLNLKEIKKLINAFNKSDSIKDAVKRFLILDAMLSARHIRQITVAGMKTIYNKPKIWSPFEMSVRPKRNIEREIKLKGGLRNGYFAVNKMVGKRTSGFGHGFEIHVIEEVKIINIAEIKRIQIKRTPAFRYLYILPNKPIKKEMVFKQNK